MISTFCAQFSRSNTTSPYFGEFWHQLFVLYLPIHKIVSVLLVIAGLFMNALLLIVLTRKKMASPSNTFLIGISVADTTVLIIYLFSWVPLITFHPFSYDFYFWTIFTLIPYLIFRSISSWITVFLALWRVVTLYLPFQTTLQLDNRNATILILACFLVVPLGFMPHLYSMKVDHHLCLISRGTSQTNQTVYTVSFPN